MVEPTLLLRPGRDKSVRRRHPWIFTGSVAAVQGRPASGQTVIVRSADGEFLARAAFSPQSQIAARVWTWNEAEPVDEHFFARRLTQAIEARASLAGRTNALRWVNAENDSLPGLIVDHYAGFAVCQFLATGAEYWKDTITAVVAAQPGVRGVYERSDVDVRAKEGLPSRAGVLSGEAPPESVEVWEADASGTDGPRVRFAVDIVRGHKTGFYLDQRDNRAVVAALARRQEVLNAFAYTGAFSVKAWQGGASAVTSLDSSGPALALARRNLALNGMSDDGVVEGDVFKVLREYRDAGRRFDLIILDPPKFAHTENQIRKATRAYKDINWLTFRLLRPGGHLVTFSCSGLVSEDLFQKVLFGAALDAGRDVQIIQRLGQATDHPVLLTFPEGAYLKGFLCRAN